MAAVATVVVGASGIVDAVSADPVAAGIIAAAVAATVINAVA